MGYFDDVLPQKTVEEKLKDAQEENNELIEEVKELQDELANKDKRTARAHDLLKQTKRFIECLKDKLSDQEITEAEAEFDRLEREEAQVTADLQDESDGNV